MTERYKQLTMDHYLREADLINLPRPKKQKVSQITVEQYIRKQQNLELFAVRRTEQIESQRELIDMALAIVAKDYLIEPEDILSSSREKDIVQARHIVVYFIHMNTDLSYKSISLCIGRNDHTTTINALKNIEGRMKWDGGFKERVERTCSDISAALSKD